MRRFLILFVIFLIDRSIDAQHIDPPVPCKTDENCSILSKNQRNPTCKGGYCVCLNEQQQLKNCSSVQVGSHHEKVMESRFYHSCKRDVDCTFNNSFCNTTRSQCECQKGYVPSAEKQHCLLVAQSLSFPCTEDKQCLAFQPNTTCQQQQCVCVTGYHAVDNVCWKMAPFGSPCTRSEECNHVNGATCTNKICSCGDGAIIDSTKRYCIPLPKMIGDRCTINDQCSKTIQLSICVDQKCQCMEGYHFVVEIGKCVVNRGIDEPCQHNYDCYQSENDTSDALQCVGSLCGCGENYLRNEDKCVSAGVPTISFPLLIILSAIVSSLYLH